MRSEARGGKTSFVRLYAMTFRDGIWTLVRSSPDFTPLDFSQRFTGRFSADGNTISGT